MKNLLTPEGKEYKNGQYYLPYAPGTNHAYSNLGAALAGVLVEEVMDEDLDRYSQKTIFNALELKHTSWHLANLNPDDIAVPYDVFQCIPYTEFCADTENVERNEIISRIFSPPRKFKRFAPYPNLTSPTWPDGGIRTSINDLSRLLEGILNNKDANNQPLLTDASYKEMFTLQFKDVSQGQRIFWRDNSKGLIGHMGDELGVLAAMYFDLHTNNGMIIMMNREMDSVTVDATKKIGYRLLDSDFSSKN